MRHRKKVNHLGRTSSHRKAMLANMAASLIMHKRISTTTAKAKALRIYVEPLLTKAKDDTTHSRRIVFGYLKNKEAVSELFREVAVKIAARPGGYTRILKTGNRLGDNADMCIIELVDYNENMLAAKEDSKAPAKRSRRGKKKTDDAAEPVVAEVKTAPKAKKTAVKSAAAVEVTDVVEDVKVEEVTDEVEVVETVKETEVAAATEVAEETEEPAEKKVKKPTAKKKDASDDEAKDADSE